ncbi:hypothetical protein BGW42_005472 [Actinomortierella wolfii]|nr:hypothetical protein BGW42_005472 [Actinomortierella wolfii]
MDSSGSTKRIAAIAGGAAGAAVVAAIAVGFFVFFRRRRARRKRMVAYLKHQQHELEAHHQQVQQCKTLASNIEDQDRMLAMNGHPPLGPSSKGSPVLSHEPSAAQVHSPASYYLGQGRRLSSKPSSPKSGLKNQAAFTSPRNAAYEHSCEGNPFYHPDLGPESG